MRIGYDKNYYKNNAKVDFGGKRIGRFRKRIPKTAWCVLLFTIFPFFTAAQAQIATHATHATINVAAFVKPRHIQLGEKARLELTLSGDVFIEHIKVPQFNFLPAFLAVPLHSETVPHLESGKIAVSMAWIYELIPQAAGDFALSDVQFDYQGSLYFANPGAIRVSGTDTYQEALTGGIHQVEVEVDTETPYLNAPFTYTFRYLYTVTLPTRESPTPRLPEFRDFFVEKPEKLPLYTRDIRGQTFWVEAHTRTLYPKSPGQLVLAPAELLLPLPKGHRTLKTKPLTLRVQPLPEVGRPVDFSGTIGEYQISAELERGWAEVGSALTLTVRVSGRGNLYVGGGATLPTIPGVLVGGPNSSYDGMPTSMTYVYTLTPVQTGTLHIPAITYSYFDPNRATYATIQTLPIPLSVRPNPNDPAVIETE
ncbi:MAG: BatD family protein, partial [Candidatus Poribacteria bacterium]|nr:BatD family protein [Candidatus Poribacteria bacterium]